MKTVITFILLLAATTMQAQNARFENAITKNLDALYKAQTTEEVQSATNAMERIAETEKSEWLAQYYAAYGNLFMGMRQEDNAKKDEYYDKALTYIAKAEELSKDNSELCVIHSWALGMKISVDPMNRGMKLGPESSMLLDQAIKLDEGNPRAYFMKGQSAMYTPKEYGGGKAAAERYLYLALQKYKTYKPSSPIMPTWGEKQATDAMAQCKQMPE